MQSPFSCLPPVLNAIEQTLSPARLARFDESAEGNKHLALRLYVWNARLCEEFYLPLQLAEVAVRNAIHYTLTRRYGQNWFENSSITSQLLDRYQRELQMLVESLREKFRSGFSADRVVAGLTFGFWVNLLTARYENLLWQQGLQRSFPHIERSLGRRAAHAKIDQLRLFRNRVAHHYAIFDQSPTTEYRNIQEILSWVCPETVWLMRELANPARVIGARPRS